MSNAAILEDRGVIAIGGDEARSFLQGLMTCDIDAVETGKPAFGALLTPQGKILFDFHVSLAPANAEGGESFLLDCRADMVGEFVKRLTFYKLRANVDLEDTSKTHSVVAVWGKPATALDSEFAEDPRLAALGWRAIVAANTQKQTLDKVADTIATLADYHCHRIANAVPEGGLDFAYGDAFPHETDMDQLNGVSFSKGCYVGQEVVSRMENRGTARTRTILATSDTDFPPSGSKIEAGGKAIGTLGSSASGKAIAIVRTDRMAKAQDNDEKITSDGLPLQLTIPEWAEFAASSSEDA